MINVFRTNVITEELIQTPDFDFNFEGNYWSKIIGSDAFVYIREAPAEKIAELKTKYEWIEEVSEEDFIAREAQNTP